MKASILSLSLLALVACGAAADNTVVEATRETRAQSLAGEACTVYEKCNMYGSGDNYGTRADCVADYNKKALDMWPADKCNANRINDGKFQNCVGAVKEQACSQGFFDAIAALDKCKSSTVCTDNAN